MTKRDDESLLGLWGLRLPPLRLSVSMFFLVHRQMAWIPSIQQLGIRQLGSRKLRNSRRDRKCRPPKLERPLWLPGYVWIIQRNPFVRHTLVCPKPSRNPPNTSFCKHLPRQEIERLHTNITNFTNQHHLMRCSSSHFLPRSITVIGVCSSLESSDSR